MAHSERLQAAMERISGAMGGGSVDPELVEALACVLEDGDEVFAEGLALEVEAS